MVRLMQLLVPLTWTMYWGKLTLLSRPLGEVGERGEFLRFRK